MNPEIIFAIPFIALVAFVIHKFILYEKEMKRWIKDSIFTIKIVDDLPYVVPNPQRGEPQD